MTNEIVIQKPVLDQSSGVFTLSSNVLLDGAEHKLYYRTSSFVPEVTSNPFLAVALLVGMKLGRPIKVEGKVSKKLLSNIRTIQEIFHSWYSDFQKIEIDCEGFSDDQHKGNGGVGCFFSGGVDSFYSVLKHKDEITNLIFVHGFDIKLSDSVLRAKVSSQLERASKELGKPLIQVETNIRDFGDSFLNWGKHYFGASLASVALTLSPALSRVFIPASLTYAELFPWGSHPLLDPLWSSEELDICLNGSEAKRLEKIASIVKYQVVLDSLRVCWKNPNSEYNCGHCEKCLRTMTSLSLFGCLSKCKTFTGALDLEKIRWLNVNDKSIRSYSEENLLALEEKGGDPELIQALKDALSGIYQTGLRGRMKRALRFLRKFLPVSLPAMQAVRIPEGGTYATQLKRKNQDEQLPVKVSQISVAADQEWIKTSADISVKGKPTHIWFRVSGVDELNPNEAFLAAGLTAAMIVDVPLMLDEAVSPKLLSRMRQIQEIYHCWNEKFNIIPILASERKTFRTPSGKVASFFSGGVDSFYTFLKHRREIEAIILMHGFDFPPDFQGREHVVKNISSVAHEFGVRLIQVETNIREILDPYTEWKFSAGPMLMSIINLLSYEFGKIYVPAADSYGSLQAFFTSPIIDPLWETEIVHIVHDGCEARRFDKVKAIATSDIVMRNLRVCWDNALDAFNCGRCEKCIRTLLELTILGKSGDCKTFKQDLDLMKLRRLRLERKSRSHFEHCLDETENFPVSYDLVQSLKDCLDETYYRSYSAWPRRAINFMNRKVLIAKNGVKQ